MINYQYMTKSQNMVLDEWMVVHTSGLGEYDDYPDVLKTTICPGCLTASNEYSFGVDQYKYFNRTMRKHEQIKELFKKTTDNRFRVLADEIAKFEVESSILDKKNNRPVNTRTRATFEKIWKQKEQYGVPFFTLMFSEPRDFITAVACFAVDRYCQMLRIAYNYDVEPKSWEAITLKLALEKQFTEKPLDIKAPEPRFFFITQNYMQAIQFIEEMLTTVYPGDSKKHRDLIDDYWRDAYTMMQLSMKNDDITAVPIELKEGGMHLLAAKLHFRFSNEEQGKYHMRYAKNYADTRLRQISSKTQQNFVNEVDDLFKLHFPPDA